jgi:hypothetical protein
MKNIDNEKSISPSTMFGDELEKILNYLTLNNDKYLILNPSNSNTYYQIKHIESGEDEFGIRNEFKILKYIKKEL